jgi:hypothetical protein
MISPYASMPCPFTLLLCSDRLLSIFLSHSHSSLSLSSAECPSDSPTRLLSPPLFSFPSMRRHDRQTQPPPPFAGFDEDDASALLRFRVTYRNWGKICPYPSLIDCHNHPPSSTKLRVIPPALTLPTYLPTYTTATAVSSVLVISFSTSDPIRRTTDNRAGANRIDDLEHRPASTATANSGHRSSIFRTWSQHLNIPPGTNAESKPRNAIY